MLEYSGYRTHYLRSATDAEGGEMAGDTGKTLHLSSRFSAAVDYAPILHVEQR